MQLELQSSKKSRAKISRMKDFDPSRRGLLGGLAIALVLPLPAIALPTPIGKVVLTVTGSPAHATTNDGPTSFFDLAMLQALPQTGFSTKTPWYLQPRRFDGVLLRDLLAAVGAPQGASVRAGALNDYRVDIPVEDVTQNGALLAYLLDDKPMTVREKGPLVIVFPFDDRPELRNAVHYSRAIWQLSKLDIQ